MLKKSHRLLVDQLSDHVAENCANSVETLVSLTNVLQAHIVKQDLLDDEDSNSLAELRASLHDTEARGMISVVRRKLMTSVESFLTRAPMTPSEVRRRYSKGRDLEVVLRNG